jgi:hypothetical protein
MESIAKLNNGTYISIGLVIACMGTVYMFGMQKQRIDDLTERVQRQESYAADVATMKEQVRQLTVTLAEVRADVKEIKEIKQRQDNDK